MGVVIKQIHVSRKDNVMQCVGKVQTMIFNGGGGGGEGGIQTW